MIGPVPKLLSAPRVRPCESLAVPQNVTDLVSCQAVSLFSRGLILTAEALPALGQAAPLQYLFYGVTLI